MLAEWTWCQNSLLSFFFWYNWSDKYIEKDLNNVSVLPPKRDGKV